MIMTQREHTPAEPNLQERGSPEKGSLRWSAWLRRFSMRHVDLALALLVTLAGLIVFAFAGIGGNSQAGFLFLQNIEQRSLDMRFAARGERSHDERIVIVGIDEKTLQNVGAFPLPRTAYATLVNKLTAGGASVIAFDVTFPTPESNSAQQALSQLQHELGPTAPANVEKKIKQL
jgi:CHASE2 domain-containing sensor protein